MSKTTKINAEAATAGRVIATFVVNREYGPYGDKTKVTNTVTIRDMGGGNFTETEEGEGRPESDERYCVTRTIEHAPVRMIQTANLAIEARPMAPMPKGRPGYYYANSIEYRYWEYAITATVNGQAVHLSVTDLARLGQFCGDVAPQDTAGNVKAY
jgi:hypothetical protein